MKPGFIAGTLVLALAASGCGGATRSDAGRTSGSSRSSRPALAAPGPPGNAAVPSPGLGGRGAARVIPGNPAVPVRLAGACSTAVSKQRRLTGVSNVSAAIPGSPFGVVVAPAGDLAFVSVTQPPSIAVLSGFPQAPKVIRRIALAASVTPLGLDLTPNGRYLLVASDSGAAVLSVARAERGDNNAELGSLYAPGGPGVTGPADGAIEVTTSRDGRYAFVSLENSGQIAVFNLAAALAGGMHTPHLVGMIRLGVAPVGLAVSPDGRWLYATSEIGGPRGRAGSAGHAGPGGRATSGQGTVSVIDVAQAERVPGRSVVASAPAGCQPVRITTSRDGDVLWITARASDELLAFSAAKLRQGAPDTLLAAVRTGEAPVGLDVVDGGRLIVVADSNRFAVRRTGTGLTVVGTAAMLSGRPSVVGELGAGLFPREMSATPDGRTLLVTDFGSGQVQAVSVAGLP